MSKELQTPIITGIVSGFCYSIIFFLADKLLRIDTLTADWPLWCRFFTFLFAVSIFTVPIYYFLVISSLPEPGGSYVALRSHLIDGGLPTRVYNQWLEAALGCVDWFFNDERRSRPSLIARFFRLETDGPRWTAPAYDRCLLMALLYPIVSIYLIWVFSGHVGIAEHALSLSESDPASRLHALRRLCGLIVLLFSFLALIKTIEVKGLWLTSAWACLTATASVSAVALTGAFAGAAMMAGACIVASIDFDEKSIGVGLSTITGIIFFFVVISMTNLLPYDVISILTFFCAFVSIVTAAVVRSPSSQDKLGYILLFATILYILICFLPALILSSSDGWPKIGTLVLFYGILTLVNAPFDWLAVGFTRALLRKGLAMGGPWPFVFAFLDIAVALFLIAALAFAMVIAIDLFDDLAAIRGGQHARILPLEQLFDGLDNAPQAYENWWVWMLLFSSMIPSLLNLNIACVSLTRGIPAVNSWVLARMPETSPVLGKHKLPIVGILTAQIVAGFGLASLAIYLVIVYAVPLGLPAFGSVIRDVARDLAAFNAPEQIIERLKK